MVHSAIPLCAIICCSSNVITVMYIVAHSKGVAYALIIVIV